MVELAAVAGKRRKPSFAAKLARTARMAVEDPGALVEGAVTLPGALARGVSTYARTHTPREALSDAARVGKGVFQDVVEHPLQTAAGALPVVGGVMSAYDTAKAREQAADARARGDERAAKLYEKMAAANGAMILAGMIPGVRTVGKALAPELRIIRNPSAKQLEALTEKSTEGYLRGMRHGDDHYWWDAAHGIHAQGAEQAGIPYDYKNRLEATTDASGYHRLGSAENGLPPSLLPKEERAKLKAKYGSGEFVTDLTPEQKQTNLLRYLESNDPETPREVYHGTSEDIHAFQLGHPTQKDAGWLGEGIYTSTAPPLASLYARNKTGGAGPNVMPLYPSLKNPYKATQEEKQALRFSDKYAIRDFTDRLKAAGHDGVVLAEPNGEKEVVVFSPTQLKSRFNRGTYDPNDPHLNKARGGLIAKYGG